MTEVAAAQVVDESAMSRSPQAVGARIRQASAWFWLEFMFWWAEHYPRMVLWTRPFFLWFAWRFSATLKNGTLANARRLLGERSTPAQRTALAKRVIRSFYLSVYELGESARLTREELRDRIEGIEGRERYIAARRSGKGAIIVTAHLGSFELGAAALVEHERRVHVVFRRDDFPRFERLRSKLRRRLGVIEAPVDEGWSAWARLRDALLNDEVVMIQGDRVMPGQRGVAVPFLGGHIRMPTGPIKLAMSTGAPIIPVFSIRTGIQRVRLVTEKAIKVDAEPASLRSERVPPTLLALGRAIEKHVAAHPEQWLMVEPAWCEDFERTRHG